jgi:hypothetical protein
MIYKLQSTCNLGGVPLNTQSVARDLKVKIKKKWKVWNP